MDTSGEHSMSPGDQERNGWRTFEEDGRREKMDVAFSFVKNSVFWDVTPCGSCKNRRFGGT
jgi:hypothetical protein